MAHYKAVAERGKTVFKEGDKFTIKPLALDIVWGGDPRYWRLPNIKNNPSVEKPVELLQVSWLEVKGELPLNELTSDKEYMVNFKLSMKPDAFGWTDNPIFLMAKPGKKMRYVWRKADLSSRAPGETFWVPTDPSREGGASRNSSSLEFKIPKDSSSGSDALLFGVYEIWKGKWKGGLLIHDVVIEPVL